MDHPTTSTHDWLTLLTGEALLFGLLGKALYSNPEEEWLQPLVDEQVFIESPFASNWPEIIEGLSRLTDWANGWQGGEKAESLVNLKTDYVRLFSGIGKSPVIPWESVYFSDNHLLFQEQTLDVRAWYRRFGLEAEKIHREPDDHIGLELLFLSHLAALGIQALNEQDNVRFEELLDAQREFFKKHIGIWAPMWCNLVEKHAQTDFYKGLASLTRGALSALAEVLDVKSPKKALR